MLGIRARAVGLTVVGWLALAPTVRAQPAEPAHEYPDEDDSEANDRPVEVHGFVSQGFVFSTGNNYLARSKRGSFELNEVGINVTKILDDRLRCGIQLFARDLGNIGDYNATFDWFYLDYQIFDWLGVRAGRTKLPFGLYNEVNDVDSARVPILLPQSIYSTRNRDYLLAQTGVEVYGYIDLGNQGLEYRLYGGTVYLKAPAGGAFRIDSQDIPYLVGGRVLWEAPLPGLRLGGSMQVLRVDWEFSSPTLIGQPGATPSGGASAKYPALLAVGSLEYAGDRLLLAAEYSQWIIDPEISVPNLVTPALDNTSERFYVMSAWRATSWLTPGAYYSAFYRFRNHRTGRENFQYDLAATLRFDVTNHFIFKVEGHAMRGTGDLQVDLNERRPLNTLTKNWVVVLAKATAHF